MNTINVCCVVIIIVIITIIIFYLQNRESFNPQSSGQRPENLYPSPSIHDQKYQQGKHLFQCPRKDMNYPYDWPLADYPGQNIMYSWTKEPYTTDTVYYRAGPQKGQPINRIEGPKDPNRRDCVVKCYKSMCCNLGFNPAPCNGVDLNSQCMRCAPDQLYSEDADGLQKIREYFDCLNTKGNTDSCREYYINARNAMERFDLGPERSVGS